MLLLTPSLSSASGILCTLSSATVSPVPGGSSIINYKIQRLKIKGAFLELFGGNKRASEQTINCCPNLEESSVYKNLNLTTDKRYD